MPQKKLNDLIEQGKKKGFLTHEQVLEKIPEIDIDILNSLEQQDIEIVDTEETIESRIDENRINSNGNLHEAVKLYLDQMGQIPMVSREKELLLAKKIDLTRKLYYKHLFSSAVGVFYFIDFVEQNKKNGKYRNQQIFETKSETRIAENIETIKKIYQKGGKKSDFYKCYKLITELDLKPDKLFSIAQKVNKIPMPDSEYKKELKRKQKEYEENKNQLASANLRLVISIAKKYRGRGLPFLDLIQEGNSGLMKAVEKYDYETGNKFSTYSTWWIRQKIRRALTETSTTVRMPVHAKEDIKKIEKHRKLYVHEYGKEPSVNELSQITGMAEKDIKKRLENNRTTMSYDSGIEDADIDSFDFLKDNASPSENQEKSDLKKVIESVLKTLTHREREIIKLRFGFYDNRHYSLEEAGEVFNITRERVRQIQEKGLRKLKHPLRLNKFEQFNYFC